MQTMGPENNYYQGVTAAVDASEPAHGRSRLWFTDPFLSIHCRTDGASGGHVRVGVTSSCPVLFQHVIGRLQRKAGSQVASHILTLVFSAACHPAIRWVQCKVRAKAALVPRPRAALTANKVQNTQLIWLKTRKS